MCGELENALGLKYYPVRRHVRRAEICSQGRSVGLSVCFARGRSRQGEVCRSVGRSVKGEVCLSVCQGGGLSVGLSGEGLSVGLSGGLARGRSVSPGGGLLVCLSVCLSTGEDGKKEAHI